MSAETDGPNADTSPDGSNSGADRREDTTGGTPGTTRSEPETTGGTPDSSTAVTKAAGTAETKTEDSTAEPGARTADATGDDSAADSTAASAETSTEPPAEQSHQLHPALIATAVALPVALIVAILVIAVMSRQPAEREPLALGSVPAPAAGSADCTRLLAAVPSTLAGDYTRSELVEPAPPGSVAWQLADGGDPIVLRCGLDRPLDFTKSAALQVINGVNWFEIRDDTTGVTSGTWYAVDRGTYIAVTMPDESGPSPLQEISNTISAQLPAKPIDPGPVPN